MVAVAVASPVHPADRGLVVRDEELDVVDLVPPVVHGIDALRHAERIELHDRAPARQNARIGDHPHLDAASLGCTKRAHHL